MVYGTWEIRSGLNYILNEIQKEVKHCKRIHIWSILPRRVLRSNRKSEARTVTQKLRHVEVKCHDVSCITNCLNLDQLWSHEWEQISFLLQPKIIFQMNFFWSLFTRRNGISCLNWIFGRSLYSCAIQKSWVHPTPQHLRLCGDLPLLCYAPLWQLCNLESHQVWNLRPRGFYLQYLLNKEGGNTKARIDQFMFAKHTGEGK